MSHAAVNGPLRVALVGAAGRMGRAIEACAARDAARYEVAVRVGRDDSLDAVGRCDVVIDFSSPATIGPVLAACRAAGKGLVLGTTGHSALERAAVADAAREVPVVFAANFSVGVNALFWLTREAARILGPDFDLEVIEVHHRLKKDAPSGTARRLAEILAEARGKSYAEDICHGREGMVGARTAGEIGMHAVRGGDVVGEHTVLLADVGERVELVHRASSRETFAAGALRAAAWLVGRTPGLYDMEDVLGLRAVPPVGA